MYYSFITCPYLPCLWAWTPTQGPWISQFWEKSTWTSWPHHAFNFLSNIYGSGEEDFFKVLNTFRYLHYYVKYYTIRIGKQANAYLSHLLLGPFLWPESMTTIEVEGFMVIMHGIFFPNMNDGGEEEMIFEN